MRSPVRRGASRCVCRSIAPSTACHGTALTSGAVAEKLKIEGKAEAMRERKLEEVEDDSGNVYDRTTYEDLARQGLL